MDIRLVDGSNGGISVGVGRQQDAAGFRVKLTSLFQELDPGHFRHTVVGQ